MIELENGGKNGNYPRSLGWKGSTEDCGYFCVNTFGGGS